MGAADIVALRQLIDRYACAVDDRESAALAALFVPGGRLIVYEADAPHEPTYVYQSAPDFATLVAEMERLYVRTFHLIGNVVCDVDGDRASGTVYCIAYHLRDDGRGAQIVTMPVRYRDSFVRTDAGWHFVQRLCIVQWRERRAAVQWPPQP